MYIYQLLTDGGRQVTREGFLNVVAFIPALLIALILHEIAHGLVALWNGDGTAKASGRLSLNPLQHFDWIGLLMMFIVGFGWAKPVPVNPYNFRKRKVGAITVSIAGVLTNILLAFVFSIGVVLLGNVKLVPDTSLYYFVYFCYALCLLTRQLNISFALFNILPLFPLDGYRLLSCFVNENNKFMTFMRRYSLYILLGLVILDYIPIVSNYAPLNLYLGRLGEYINKGFTRFWEIVFNV